MQGLSHLQQVLALGDSLMVIPLSAIKTVLMHNAPGQEASS